MLGSLPLSNRYLTLGKQYFFAPDGSQEGTDHSHELLLLICLTFAPPQLHSDFNESVKVTHPAPS